MEVLIHKLNLNSVNTILQFNMKQSQENKKIWNNYLNSLRVKYESYIPNPHRNTDYHAVIIESRPNIDLETVIKNTFYFLSQSKKNWGLTLFYTNKNEEFVNSRFLNYPNINLLKLDLSEINLYIYDDILLSENFWNIIHSENILIFQLDSTLLKAGIDEFLNWDYIGAPWTKPKEKKLVGNGGLSFRKKSVMLDIIKKYKQDKYIKEDIFFCKYISKLPTVETASKFSVEDVYYDNPLGIHQPKIDPEKLKELLDKSLERIKL